MKKVRECFHMLITAVICLMVSMVPGKNVTAAIVENNVASEILSTREKHMADRFTQSVMDKMRSFWKCLSFFQLNINRTDFTVSADTHCRPPDTGSGSRNISHVVFT